jgi:hypothetical protein
MISMMDKDPAFFCGRRENPAVSNGPEIRYLIPSSDEAVISTIPFGEDALTNGKTDPILCLESAIDAISCRALDRSAVGFLRRPGYISNAGDVASHGLWLRKHIDVLSRRGIQILPDNDNRKDKIDAGIALAQGMCADAASLGIPSGIVSMNDLGWTGKDPNEHLKALANKA